MRTRLAMRMGAVVAVLACGSGSARPSAEVLRDARRELAARGAADQRVRERFGEGGHIDPAQAMAMVQTDSANTAWLKGWVARWGWPTVEDVGRPAVTAAFLIVQHAVHDTAFMRAMLPFVAQAAERGELDGGDVALLTDRLEVKAGRPQIYGTQLSMRDGQLQFDPIADSAQVDQRRRRMGLPPLAEYRRLMDSIMRMP